MPNLSWEVSWLRLHDLLASLVFYSKQTTLGETASFC